MTIPRRTIHVQDGALHELLSAAVESPGGQTALVAAFEDAFTRHAGTGFAVPVGAGRLGLRPLLKGLGIRAGSQVIVPAFTDESVPEAVRAAGATPIFVDVERDTMNLDPAAVARALTPQTRAILATHIFGNPCDLGALLAIADGHGAYLLEDCAHAIDARWQGALCGTIGHAAIFSFVVTKAVNTFGGGLVLTRDGELAGYVRSAVASLPQPKFAALARRVMAGYALAGLTSEPVFGRLGGPALRLIDRFGGDALRLYNRVARPATVNADVDTAFSPIQAAVGLPQMRRLLATQTLRRHAAEALCAAMPSALTPQRVLPGAEHAWYFLVATAADPDRVARTLLKRGLDVGRHPMRNVARLSGHPASAFPGAEFLEAHAIQIPIHPELDPASLRQAAEALRAL